MIPNRDGTILSTQIEAQPGELLTGDLGLLILRSLLENGVGYVVGSWQDQPTPIDTALEDARKGILTRRGVITRRLKNFSSLEQTLFSTAKIVDAEQNVDAYLRGFVVFGGQRGMRASLEQFSKLSVSGSVVGVCFDEDALKIPDAIVIDPEQTPAGLMHAMQLAFLASRNISHPVLILLRERMLGIRGTIRCEQTNTPMQAAFKDLSLPHDLSIVEASKSCELVRIFHSANSTDKAWIITHSPLLETVKRVLSAHDLKDIGLIEKRASLRGISIPSVDDVIGNNERVLLLDDLVDQTSAHALDVERAIISWLKLSENEFSVAKRLSSTILNLDNRIPSRDESLHRAISPSVAAGLILAQGVIGVPARLDQRFNTYQTETGVALTIVTGQEFAEQGVALVNPSTSNGVIVVTTYDARAINNAAGSVEYVSENDPHAIGCAVGKACRSTRLSYHTIFITTSQQSTSMNSVMSGIDPDIIGIDRISTAVSSNPKISMFEHDAALNAGPIQIPQNTAEFNSNLPYLRKLTAASWSLKLNRRAGSSKLYDAIWNTKRSILRSVGGIDL